MKKLFLNFLLLATAMVGFGQNEKNIVVDANAEVRHIGNFNAIELSGAIDLYLSQGTEEGLAVSAANDEIRSRIKTEIKGNTLHIYVDGKGLNWKLWGNNKMKAYVTFKNLNKIESSGACNVKSTEPIHSPDLLIELSGASDFSGTVKVDKLRLSASGASNFKISGTAENTVIEASGACDIKGYDLKTNMCKANASGASNINITVNKELNASASGGSSIHYKGEGVIRDISAGGGASIKHRTDE